MSLSKASKRQESFLLTLKRLVLQLRRQALERPQLAQADRLGTILARDLPFQEELRKDIPRSLNSLLTLDDLLVVMEDPPVTGEILQVSRTLLKDFLLKFTVKIITSDEFFLKFSKYFQLNRIKHLRVDHQLLMAPVDPPTREILEVKLAPDQVPTRGHSHPTPTVVDSHRAAIQEEDRQHKGTNNKDEGTDPGDIVRKDKANAILKCNHHLTACQIFLRIFYCYKNCRKL